MVSSGKKRSKGLFAFLGALIPFALVFGILFAIGGCNNNQRREKLIGIWGIPVEGKFYLFTFSNIHSGGKVSTENYHFRLIDPETGKIEYKRKINVGYGDMEIACLTPTSLWIKKREGLNCLDFPSFKTRWNKKKFYEYLEKKYPDKGKIFNAVFVGNMIKVTTVKGEELLYSPLQFEPGGPTKSSWQVLYLNNYDQLGYLSGYPVPHKTEPEKVVIEIVSDEYQPPTKNMTLIEKLEIDTGYARNYAVFAPDSSCFLFDGNKLRTLKKLVNDSVALIWKDLLQGKTWLEGDMLRPLKRYNDLPENRLISVYKNIMFIHYQTSLDEKENQSHLAGFDYITEKIIWDIDLTSSKIKRAERPEQNFVYKTNLITVWTNYNDQAVITAIDVNTGERKWMIRK